MKRFLCAALAMVMCLGVCLAFTACDDTPPDQPPVDDNNYHVTITDHFGAPKSDIIVTIETAEGPVMRVTGDDGKVGFHLTEGEYTFTLISPQGTPLQYDESACKLTATEKDMTVVVYDSPIHGSQEIWCVPYGEEGDERKAYNAYYVKGGATWVTLTPGDITYFIYTAEAAGIFEFALEGGVVGYYGGPYFVQTNSLVEPVNGKIEIEIRDSNLAHGEGVATPYVIGVYSEVATTGILTIGRKADNPYIPEVDEPWISYTAPQSAIKEYIIHNINDTVSAFKDIDITSATAKVVYSEADGYYHYGTVDGPVVMMRLTTASAYLAPLYDVAGAALMGKIFYEEDGTFIKKESYNELFLQYADVVDINGCVPLDAYLAHGLQNRGEYCGWWKEDAMMYLFTDVIENVENAWLFACGYYETVTPGTHGTENTPAVLGLEYLNFGKAYATLTAGQTLYIKADLNMTVTISDPEGLYTVTYNGTTVNHTGSGRIVVTINTTTANTFTITLAEGGEDVRVLLTLAAE